MEDRLELLCKGRILAYMSNIKDATDVIIFLEGDQVKKVLLLLLVIIVLLSILSSCSYRGTYDDGYADGYSDGYSNALSEARDLLEDEFSSGYDVGRDDGYDYGYDDGFFDGYNQAENDFAYYGWLEDEAIRHARQYSEWSPEEAIGVIEAYHNNEPFWQDGSAPSNDEYLDAIESLCRFYEYFYCAMYE